MPLRQLAEWPPWIETALQPIDSLVKRQRFKLVPSKHLSSGEHFRQPALVQLLACAVVQNHKVSKRKYEFADMRALALEQCGRLGVSTRCVHELELIVARLPNRVLTDFWLTPWAYGDLIVVCFQKCRFASPFRQVAAGRGM